MLNLKDFIREHGGEFKPFAFYNESLDFISVRLKDCSITEDYINDSVTLLRATHSPSEVVGFNINHASSLLRA